MKVCIFLLVVWLAGMWVKPTAGGIKLLSAAKWGTRVNKAGRVGKLGEISLKSTLGVLSMAGSLALFSAIESALQPDDIVGHQWLQAQKEEWQYEMWPFYHKPFAIAGVIIMLMILSGGGLGLRARMRRQDERKRTQQQIDKEEETEKEDVDEEV